MSIKELVEKLTKCDYQYTIGAPIITDMAYDELREQLYKLDPKNKYFKIIGCEATDNCVKLPYHLGSQTKIKEDKDLQKWIKKYNTNDYVISEKLDGISAYYNKAENKLYTRGNGKTGSDISHILPHINLPVINTDIVRGELLISKKNWKEEYGSNARNVVAGLVNAKTLNIKLLKFVDLVIYQVIDKSIKMEEQLKLITKNSVKYSIIKEPLTINNLKILLNTYKASSAYEIDGIVVTDNSKAYDNIKTGNPNFAFAFKNAELDENAITTVIDVEYKLSKDNRYKPRVIFNKVKLDQVNIECASGYNAKFIKDNGIGVGAKIRIVRSGQVIPKIIEVITKASVPKMPDGEWEWDITNTDAMFVKKVNEESPKEQRVGRAVHFFKTLGVKNLAEGTIVKLYDKGFKTLESVLDIKDPSELKNIPGIGDKKIEVIIKCIKEALSCKILEDIMAASNIFERSLGSKKLKLIITNYDDIMNDNIKIDDLMTVHGIGKVNAEQFIVGFNDFKVFYNKYYNGTIEPEDHTEPEKALDKRLVGKKVSFTGVRNKELEKLIEKYEGKVVSTVSKTLDVLITKDINSNSSSMKKAKELNILIIEYDMLII
jgi:DNA ligase (NAD+)|tara:strand:+ start:1166 stop:2971 length:1806 start_codon:yes stop_codon:yes gene_type:complete